ncbi:unnamed protein product [Mytilus coruscus]|uniref:Uncharacterized protein n=1 Tax=Mytilus coruscus TaxID=42192 RepID=A0A6J8C5V4_MYTCO|nr:unnamed protein product [Mytilus coruscus]
MKCEFTSYDCFDGIIDRIDNGYGYFCYDDNSTHFNRDDWFSEHTTTKKAAKCQTEQENTNDQKKDGDRIFLEFHVQKNINKGSFSTEEINMTKMGKIAIEILADALYDLLKLDTHSDPNYQIYPQSHWDITSLYHEHKKLNWHTPRISSNRRGYWGGK